MSSREQKLEAALREAEELLGYLGGCLIGSLRTIKMIRSARERIDAVLGEQEATPPEPTTQSERGDVERWPGTTPRPWFVEGLAAMDRFRSRVILMVGDSDQDRADLALIVDAVNTYAPSPLTPPDELAQIIVRTSAPQGEPEPSDDQPKVIESWLRWNDVECVRCRRMAGWEGERCYVVDEGVICDECTTDAEKARAVPQR